MGTTNTILASIDAINAEIKSHQDSIARLTAARDTIGSLVDVNEAKAVRTTQRNKPTATTSQVTRKATKRSNGKASRRDQIVTLLADGMSPREIGNELGIAPNYVYHVKRSLNGDAPTPVESTDESPRKPASERRAEADAKLDAILQRENKSAKTITRKRAPKPTKGTGARRRSTAKAGK